MNRRECIALLGGAGATWPLAARAQQPDRVRRIGVLVHDLQTRAEWQQRIAAFQQGLERRGWLEGRNISIELRSSDNKYDRLQPLAQEIVALKPDVILATPTPAIKALQQETRTIPIVFVQASDPIGSGLVASLARPGGNITGFLFYEDSITGKWLGMLKEIAPHLMRAVLVGHPKNPNLYAYLAHGQSHRAVARDRSPGWRRREWR
jgi:putative tryptophan/tyrosine transport system substrate-binding protein